MEEASVAEMSQFTSQFTEVKFQILIVFFVLAMILLVYILKHLKRGDIFAERQQ